MIEQKLNVVNFHCTDICNYNCIHCFVNKEKNIVSLDNAKLCVDKIYKYFANNHIDNGRINIAGGEPLCYKYLIPLIDYIYEKNIECSIITNGYLLTQEFIDKIKGKVSMIGVSIDALSVENNIKLGRCSITKALNEEEYLKRCNMIKNAGIKLKINICVNKINLKCDFSKFLRKVTPDRLKLLQISIQEGINKNASFLQITLEEFNCFCEKLKKFNPVIEKDEDILQSYLILDSKCCLSYNNSHNSNYNLLNMDMDNIIKNLNIDSLKFNNRYKN